MIVVIADDFSGAAEIAGLSLDYGISSYVSFDVMCKKEYDLIIITTNTRSTSKNQAIQINQKIVEQLTGLEYKWLFKKVDSVMRGYILPELITLMKALNKNQALIVLSNPDLGRITRNGKYYVHNQLLHKTEFSCDPEFSIQTSDILKILGNSNEYRIHILKTDEKIPPNCIAVGEAQTNSDIHYWAEQITSQILPAGSASFFGRLLEVNGYKKRENGRKKKLIFGEKALYVLSSSFSNSITDLNQIPVNGFFISQIPDDLFYGRGKIAQLLEVWLYSILDAFQRYSKVVITINKPIIQRRKVAQNLRTYITKIVKQIFLNIPLEELFIEGGATSYEIMEALNFSEFIPVEKLAPGVIRMKIRKHPGLFLTVKPGSYKWPKQIWTYNAQ